MSSRSDDEARDPVLGAALRWLAFRPRTRHEMRQRLKRLGHPEIEVERVVEQFVQRRWLDDVALARQYIAMRASRLGHGPARLFRDLQRRGVTDEDVASAWQQVRDEGEVEPDALLQREVQRRLARCGNALDARDYRRVYNALLRAGFEASAIGSALRPFRDTSESAES